MSNSTVQNQRRQALLVSRGSGEVRPPTPYFCREQLRERQVCNSEELNETEVLQPTEAGSQALFKSRRPISCEYRFYSTN